MFFTTGLVIFTTDPFGSRPAEMKGIFGLFMRAPRSLLSDTGYLNEIKSGFFLSIFSPGRRLRRRRHRRRRRPFRAFENKHFEVFALVRVFYTHNIQRERRVHRGRAT